MWPAGVFPLAGVPRGPVPATQSGGRAGRRLNRERHVPPARPILYAGISGGLGRLTIKNGPSQDGVVTLVRGRSKAISVYVRARSSTTVRNIKDGTYTIYYTTGSPFSFSVSNGHFTSGATYWRFNNRALFVPPPQYTVATLTLYAVRGGNAPTTPIPPGDYPS